MFEGLLSALSEIIFNVSAAIRVCVCVMCVSFSFCWPAECRWTCIFESGITRSGRRKSFTDAVSKRLSSSVVNVFNRSVRAHNEGMYVRVRVPARRPTTIVANEDNTTVHETKKKKRSSTFIAGTRKRSIAPDAEDRLVFVVRITFNKSTSCRTVASKKQFNEKNGVRMNACERNHRPFRMKLG